MTSLYPLKIQPALHVKVWGGRKLETLYHRALPTAEPYGESWELHDTATVANGPLAGQTVGALLKDYGHALVGPANDPAVGFPLLAKILTAEDWLSVQVHPNDEQAVELEGEPRGKTEAWYVLNAAPGATLVKAVKPGTTREAMAEAIRTNTLEPLLVYAEVQPGDVLYVTAGTIHALGPGLVIYEIQQSSDTTYRLYDWGRMDLNGQPRALHIEKGVLVSTVDSVPEIKQTGSNTLPVVDVAQGPYFTTVLHQLNPRNGPRITLDTHGTHFHILTCIEGSVTVSAGDVHFELAQAETGLIPASVGAYTLSGSARVLRSWQG
ncbi:MAG TPA: class I mannose-6-phosphate isomerase [Aggregatilineales bacterium]|nr:class I mannose-6-phosphate isomerase [Anaerolineae bacterium]HUN10353.1 class I mannose-6-phosphate isomerase [Aggregatilineales bacterium]